MMLLQGVSKEDRAHETVWTGQIPRERIRKAIVDTIASELGFGFEPPDVTMTFSPAVDVTLSFRAVRDNDHWRKRLEAQADKAVYDDAATG